LLLFSNNPCFLGLHLPKLQKPQKKKKNFLTNIEKQIGSGSEENKIVALKEKEKRGSQSSSFAKA